MDFRSEMVRQHVTFIELSTGVKTLCGTINGVPFELVELLGLTSKSRSALVSENLFLRKQLAPFQEPHVRPHRAGGLGEMADALLKSGCSTGAALSWQ